MSEAQFLKVKKNRATKMAKDFHSADLFQRESRTILERFKALRQEIVEKQLKEKEEGEMRGRKPFRIGGPVTGSTNMADQNNNFYGDVGLVSAYPVCLSSDRVHAHYLAANRCDTLILCTNFLHTTSQYSLSYSEIPSHPLTNPV